MTTVQEYVDRIVAAWPPLTPEQHTRIGAIMHKPSGETYTENPRTVAIQEARETLARTQAQFKEALTGCQGCGLSRAAHDYQRNHGTGYHQFSELTPDGAIKVSVTYRAKIAEAEDALARAQAA